MQQQIHTFIYSTANSVGEVFSYKGENYIKSGNGAVLFSITNNALSLGSLNQGQIFSDALTNCNANLPNGYNCTNMQFLGLGTMPDDYRMKSKANSVIYSITNGVTPISYIMITDGVDSTINMSIENMMIGYGKFVDQFYLQSMFESI